MITVRLLLLALLLLAPGRLAGADDGSSDGRFLAGLRQRGLYRLAETYCLDRLADAELPDVPRAKLVIELSRCLAERAVGSPAELRPPLWQRASQVIDEFARDDPQNSRLLLVGLQGALTNLTRGELARQEAEVLADGERRFTEARHPLRAAIGRLRELAEAVDRRLQRPDASKQKDVDLLSLKNNVQYQLARALRNQAACYAKDSPDRVNSLTQAVELLATLVKLDPADPLAWKSRLDLVACYRLLADYETAGRQLEALSAPDPPPSMALRLRAEQIHLALAAGQLTEAISAVSQGRQIDGKVSAELDYAWLMTYLRAAGEAPDKATAAPWQAKATDLVEQIEQRHGPYWTRRAGMLLSRHVRTSPGGTDLATLVRAAESSFRSGQFDDAVATYDSARAVAGREGDTNRAFELGYIAATIEHRRDRHEKALTRYRQIATATPDHPQAAEAHLWAIYHSGQLAKAQPQGSLQDYAVLLQEHLQIWSKQPSAGRVYWRLGRLREHQRDWPRAITAYRAISPEDAEYPKAIEATGRCYEKWFQKRKVAGEADDRIAADAADAAAGFESLIAGSDEPSTEVHRLAALAAGRLRLGHTTTGYVRAQQILSAALQNAGDAPPEWKSAAATWLAFSLAGQRRHREAAEVLAEISAGGSEELLGMLEGLGRVAATARPEVRAELAKLQLQAAELLQPRRGQLSAAQQRTLKRIQTQAEIALREAGARSLLEREDRASLEEALAQWRVLEKKFPTGSPQWFDAKYAVALSHYRLGNKPQAGRIIRLLQLLHPESGGPEMKARFDELLRRCGR